MVGGGRPPVRRAGRHVGAGKIVVLMAGAAFFSSNTVTLRAPSHVHGVRMTVVSLPREVTARMAVHATRMAQH